ncbi:MAG: SMC-Scp complex subunit ScpB [Gammaproteobacteria bacterium]|jgi:segregation and condensation protein B
MIDKQQQIRIIEGAIFASDKPLTVNEIANLFIEEEKPSTAEVKALMAELTQIYAGRGVELNHVASGYCFRVAADLAPWVCRLWEQKPPRYSRALLETLAVIAYRQPVTRGDIEQIRGVSVSPNTIKTLLDREWIKIVGHREVPGRPELMATTPLFLDYFGLKALDELPALIQVLIEKDNSDKDEQISLELKMSEASELTITAPSSSSQMENNS